MWSLSTECPSNRVAFRSQGFCGLAVSHNSLVFLFLISLFHYKKLIYSWVSIPNPLTTLFYPPHPYSKAPMALVVGARGEIIGSAPSYLCFLHWENILPYNSASKCHSLPWNFFIPFQFSLQVYQVFYLLLILLDSCRPIIKKSPWSIQRGFTILA